MPRNKYHDTPVVEFHETFGAPVVWSPKVLEEGRRRLRCSLLLEEVLEFIHASGFTIVGQLGAHKFEATHESDMVEVADGLADIQYVTHGAALEWGIPLEKVFREVHRSNMSKVGPDGKAIFREDGKILKGPNFAPPMIAEILELYKGIDNGSK